MRNLRGKIGKSPSIGGKGRFAEQKLHLLTMATELSELIKLFIERSSLISVYSIKNAREILADSKKIIAPEL